MSEVDKLDVKLTLSSCEVFDFGFYISTWFVGLPKTINKLFLLRLHLWNIFNEILEENTHFSNRC
ncbi:hypothetical protein HanIR_Chr02g0058961 [Helianthus annuus]|nr:hypothetical protein HanIR_Chr02g0058961 [Helianthus annuus]